MNNFCCVVDGLIANECSYLKDKNQRIHELEEKICGYKAKVRDLYQVDISDLKKTIRCLKERIEEFECENERLNKELLEKDKRIQDLETGFYNISDPDLLGEARRRGYTLRSREALFRTLIDFDSQIADLRKENVKLNDLKQHLINHVSNKEAEIVNLKEENEKLKEDFEVYAREILEKNKRIEELENGWKDILGIASPSKIIPELCSICGKNVTQEEMKHLKEAINRVYGVESSLEKDSEDSTDGSYIYISLPKGQKVSNFEVYFQEESSPITTDSNILISPTGGDVNGHNISK